MLYFKRLIQIPRLPEVLRPLEAAARLQPFSCRGFWALCA